MESLQAMWVKVKHFLLGIALVYHQISEFSPAGWRAPIWFMLWKFLAEIIFVISFSISSLDIERRLGSSLPPCRDDFFLGSGSLFCLISNYCFANSSPIERIWVHSRLGFLHDFENYRFQNRDKRLVLFLVILRIVDFRIEFQFYWLWG